MAVVGRDRFLKITREADQVEHAPTSSSSTPPFWACGWVEATGRCVRLHCREDGPCDGYSGP